MMVVVVVVKMMIMIMIMIIIIIIQEYRILAEKSSCSAHMQFELSIL